VQFLETNGKNAFKGILPFDRVVRPFGYYGKKLHSTQFDTKISD
jgi:hypothetical protein